MHPCVHSDHIQILPLLVQACVNHEHDINAIGRGGQTPLLHAILVRLRGYQCITDGAQFGERRVMSPTPRLACPSSEQQGQGGGLAAKQRG